MKKSIDLQDLAIRVLLIMAGGVAATLLALKGHGEAIPALALGATLGAVVMARVTPTEE